MAYTLPATLNNGDTFFASHWSALRTSLTQLQTDKAEKAGSAAQAFAASAFTEGGTALTAKYAAIAGNASQAFAASAFTEGGTALSAKYAVSLNSTVQKLKKAAAPAVTDFTDLGSVAGKKFLVLVHVSATKNTSAGYVSARVETSDSSGFGTNWNDIVVATGYSNASAEYNLAGATIVTTSATVRYIQVTTTNGSTMDTTAPQYTVIPLN